MAAASSFSGDNHNKTKSVGTQHDASHANVFDPWIKQNSVPNSSTKSSDNKPKTNNASQQTSSSSTLTRKLANPNAKLIVITDDFKKKALSNNQEVMVDTKRKILRYMKANKLMSSSRSMDDVRISTDEPNEVTLKAMNMNEHQMNSSVLSMERVKDNTGNVEKAKPISKSVDNISVKSGELDDVLDNVGSVELIFISDEFLNKVSKDQDVIILKNYPNKANTLNTRKTGQSNTANIHKIKINANRNGHTNTNKQIVVVSDDFRRKSLKDQSIVIVDEPKRTNGNDNDTDSDETGTVNGHSNKCKNQHAKLNRQSSAETSIDDVNNKITSRAFQSYDEEPEHLESKEIKTDEIQ